MLDLPDGASLHYEIAGQGPTVTLIHPGLWDMRTWDREFRAFQDAGFRVLRYDVRGYGKSSRPEPGTSYSHVHDLAALLEAAEVVHTALVGCSMGGGIELDHALVHPEQVWALVLVASAVGGFQENEEEEEWWAQREAPIRAAVEVGELERAQISDWRSGLRSVPTTSAGRGSERSPSTTSTRSRWTRAARSGSIRPRPIGWRRSTSQP